MTVEQFGTLSDTLFRTAFFGYIAAMIAYFFAMASARVTVDGPGEPSMLGRRVGALATLVTVTALGVHAASVATRAAAAGWRMPLGNMYEYSSALALFAVAIGLVVVQRRLGYRNLMGFVLAAAVLMMASAIVLYSDPGPLVPALQSYWLQIHVSSMMGSASIFIVGFAITALYLVKDAGERRAAALVTTDAGEFEFSGSTAGAAQVSTSSRDGGDGEGADPDRPVGYAADDGEASSRERPHPLAQREALSPVLFPIVPAVVAAVFTLVVWRAPVPALVAGSVAALLGTATWYAVPYLPDSARLDNLAYRTIAFAFPIFTFGVIAGAIWAEEAWGRYWGWDPKETGSFFTWVLYAAYLHARSTHGWRGRRAAWVGVIAFTALMVTYYAVNLWVVGLHSYAGL